MCTPSISQAPRPRAWYREINRTREAWVRAAIAVLIRANTITVAATGLVSTAGEAGVTGNSSACSGVGCGMGGGGGAGGTVRLETLGAATIGAGRLVSLGAGGATGTCGTRPGGTGSVGRIGVHAATVTGTSSPAFDTN